MKLVQDLIILAAKILIFIGDVTLLTLSLPWKALKPLLEVSKFSHQKKATQIYG